MPLVGAGSANAAASPQAEAASSWLATLVGPDGSVDDPYSGNPSLTWTANVALSLATTGNEPDALQRALDHLADRRRRLHRRGHLRPGRSPRRG